jgi:hypothetical protein
MEQSGLTQEQRLRDLMRADAEFSRKGSDSQQDLISGYASSSDASTRQAIDRDVSSSGDAIRGIRDQIAANRQLRPSLLMQVGQQFQAAAQSAFENQMAIRAAQQQRQQRFQNRVTRTELGLKGAEAFTAAHPGVEPVSSAELDRILKTDLGFDRKIGASSVPVEGADIGDKIRILQKAYPSLTTPQIEYLVRTAFPAIYAGVPSGSGRDWATENRLRGQ